MSCTDEVFGKDTVAMGGDPYISSFGEVIILQSARNRSTSGTKVRWCWNTPPWPELG